MNKEVSDFLDEMQFIFGGLFVVGIIIFCGGILLFREIWLKYFN